MKYRIEYRDALGVAVTRPRPYETYHQARAAMEAFRSEQSYSCKAWVVDEYGNQCPE